jgi:ubiquinone/menaquinone biosynthesis C-methylase UbiE
MLNMHPRESQLTHAQPELERLDLQHAILKTLFNNKNHFAPIKKPRRMIDIGCGTGKWCVEMGMHAAHTYTVNTANIWQLRNSQTHEYVNQT